MLSLEAEFYGTVADPCDYLMLPQVYFKYPTGFAVKRGSPFEDVFNVA